MDKKQRIVILLAIIIITGAIGTVLGYSYSDELKNPLVKRYSNKDWDGNSTNRTYPQEFNNEIESAEENHDIYVTIKTAITLVNITIGVILIGMYIKIFKEIKSDFTIGLIIVMTALVLYAITSNPFVQMLFDYRSFGLGPFILIPDLCSTLALSVLFYLSLK